MKLYGLIGFPLSHSFSKKYFTDKFLKEGIEDCVYELFPLEHINHLPQLVQAHPYLCGLNVTIPYKEQVLPYLNDYSKVVAETGACNCITIRNGHLKGYNTDVAGFEQSLKPLLQAHHTKALILGTGGAAKAVEWVLKNIGIDCRYVSRKKIDGILSYDELDEALLTDYPLIINTTPLGMQPNVTTKPSLPYAGIGPNHLCYDLVYNPAVTAFLQEASQRGAVIKNGLEMLELQAEEGWRLWNSE